jgi:hypothetical protein
MLCRIPGTCDIGKNGCWTRLINWIESRSQRYLSSPLSNISRSSRDSHGRRRCSFFCTLSSKYNFFLFHWGFENTRYILLTPCKCKANLPVKAGYVKMSCLHAFIFTIIKSPVISIYLRRLFASTTSSKERNRPESALRSGKWI